MTDIKKIISKAFAEGVKEIEINNVRIDAEHLEIQISQMQQLMPMLSQVPEKAVKGKAFEDIKVEPFHFTSPAEKYKRQISEVVLGATKSDGGTRECAYTIGGETAPPYYFFEGMPKNKPIVAHDVFDMAIPLPKQIKEFFGDAMESPGEWAKKRVDMGAKMVVLHLVSTDPNVKDTPIKEAVKSVEEVLQAVKVPIAIGGSGNPEKDPKLLAKVAEVCEGEKVLLNSVDEGMDYKLVAEAVKKYDQRIITLSSMNPDEMKRINKNMLKIINKNQLVMDLVTGAVGYGIEYSISSMERSRLAGLKGDAAMALPIACAGSNAWGAREAWMTNDDWGPRELRGPLWEAMTMTIALLCGADFFMGVHPTALKTLENVIDSLYDGVGYKEAEYESWIGM
ncbi:MAG: CO dehydrogenase/acetyl-CoA synthase subunit delta [Candidatus Altiarchaeales archaeon HGW-Altiarchaeales-3]|nr:MAG: CO dehydrogenase/acetyl-CoA synthase subunit delta [Candidatus Altiarchaeales archaeon HGW-Altiarchaeales-3]